VLGSLAQEALERFVATLERCGLNRMQIAQEFSGSGRASRNKPTLPVGPRLELPEAAHLITLWCSDPNYVDGNGEPLALPAKGAHRSLQALLRRVRSEHPDKEIIDYLHHMGAIRRTRGLFSLTRRWLFVRGVPGSAEARTLRELVGMLKTLEHNLAAPASESGWFEFMAFNPNFPVRELPAFDQFLRRDGLGLLRKADHFLEQRESARKPGEPTVWVGLSLHQVQQDTPQSGGKLPVRARKRRRKR
jgi:hypothetical protein